MRFLLHPVAAARRAPPPVGRRRPPLAPMLTPPAVTADGGAAAATPSVVPPATSPGVVEAPCSASWGQQCGARCGCVLRFEAVSDPGGAILSASYTAKRLLLDRCGRPQRAPRTGRPLAAPADCAALHRLAGAAVGPAFLTAPHATRARCRAQLEFSGPRSAPAFAAAALAAQGLPAMGAGHCFDLVEEALTALLKGHLPAPRRRRQQQRRWPPQPHAPWEEEEEEPAPGPHLGGTRASATAPAGSPDFTLFAPSRWAHSEEFPFGPYLWRRGAAEDEGDGGPAVGGVPGTDPGRDDGDDAAPPRISLLDLMDEQQQQQQQQQQLVQAVPGYAQHRGAAFGAPLLRHPGLHPLPGDWVEYVDRLMLQQREAEARAGRTRPEAASA